MVPVPDGGVCEETVEVQWIQRQDIVEMLQYSSLF